MEIPVRSKEQPAAEGRRPVVLVGAPSNIGIRPYDDTGEARHIDQAPAVLRSLGLAARLGAGDLGDVVPPPYRDFARPPGRPRNEEEMVVYSRALAERVALGVAEGRFVLVLGGDCGIVLGSLLGARRAGRVGLVYVDAHDDFATPEESETGSAAGMCLAMAVGRGDSPLARLAGPAPLVRAGDAVLIGRREAYAPADGQAALRTSGILDLPDEVPARTWSPATAAVALERAGRDEVDGFWIHVDADVLDPRVMPAVDSPEPGGPGLDGLAALLGPLVAHPRALGLQVTLYDPSLDADRTCAERLVALLEQLFAARGAR